MNLDNNNPAPKGRRDRQTRLETEGVQALYDKLDRLMAKAKPTKREQMQQRFRELYPRLESYLMSGRLVRDVLTAFNDLAQANVCARTFNDMLDQERARRDENGNLICCDTCGQALKPTRKSATPNLSSTKTPISSLIPSASE
ncbi:hypothetical protein [Lysobacter silvisoli]|uniref:Uncharacterized protein n=1 Tax=Lysobacter silvisoli TaxID=2293254 RepID=A0A371K0K3_9GAMM|nr:hypothetical protein [Lysobacter silvisoli]RDZ27453.1 hypothetical protein DX914_14600 [Lysobacter silvisoli]